MYAPTRCVFASLIVLFAGLQPEYAGAQRPVAGIFTHELTFGARRISKEFQLSQTTGIAVDDNGNMLVLDAGLIKVFDGNGNGKEIMGLHHEFSTLTGVRIAPGGYITAQTVNGYSIFTPDRRLGFRVYFAESPTYNNMLRNLKLRMTIPKRIVLLNENERVFSGEVAGYGKNREIVYSNLLAYEHGEEIENIAQYEIMNKVWTGSKSHTMPRLGEFHWTLLPGRRIVFTHTGYDKRTDGNASWYILHVYSLDKSAVSDIEIPYRPVPFSKEVLENAGPGFYPAGMPPEEVRKVFQDRLKRAGAYPQVRELLADGAFIFAVTLNQTPEEETLVNVVDADAGRHITSAYFPFIPSCIKNGRAYNIEWEEQKIPEISVYRVNPALYGK